FKLLNKFVASAEASRSPTSLAIRLSCSRAQAEVTPRAPRMAASRIRRIPFSTSFGALRALIVSPSHLKIVSSFDHVLRITAGAQCIVWALRVHGWPKMNLNFSNIKEKSDLATDGHGCGLSRDTNPS